MKTFTYYKCKSIAKKIGVLGLTALMIASCGSDNENKTDTSATGNPFNAPSGTSDVFINPNTGVNSQDLSTWNNLKNQTNCPQGRMQDLTFTVSAQNNYYGGYSSSVSGTMQQGQVSGTSQGSYYGRSGQGDLMFVSKVSTGSNQAAYNIVLSYCIYQDYIAQYIGPNAGMTNFVVQNMQLSQSTNCSAGSVTSAVVGFISPNYSQNQYVPIQYAPVANSNQCF